MQHFEETIRLTDPPLPPKEETPSQRLFHAFMTGGQVAMEAEHRRMHPGSPTPASTSPHSPRN